MKMVNSYSVNMFILEENAYENEEKPMKKVKESIGDRIVTWCIHSIGARKEGSKKKKGKQYQKT